MPSTAAADPDVIDLAEYRALRFKKKRYVFDTLASWLVGSSWTPHLDLPHVEGGRQLHAGTPHELGGALDIWPGDDVRGSR